MDSTLTFPLFRLAGIPVRMSLLAPVFAVLMIVTWPGYSRPETLLMLLGWEAVWIGSVLAHELGHAYAARRDRLAVHGITLHVLGGHTVHDEARTTGSELRISLAGIAVNLLVAAAAGAAVWIVTGSFPGAPSLAVAPHLLLVVWGVNLWLAMFNLLPGIPFDGGHAAETLLARKFPRRRARIAVLTSGTIIAGALIVLGLTGQDMLLSFVGFSALMAVVAGWRSLREESAANEAFLGTYDFSNGYTSLEKGAPKPAPRESRAEIRRREREQAAEEAREAAAAREARDSKARLDRLLDRIAADGISSLTTEERAFLNEQSRRLRDRVKR